MERKKESYDMTTLPKAVRPIDADFQQIVLIRRGANGKVENEEFFLMTPDNPERRRVWITKSLRYASHSEHLGITGPSLLQLSLAICLYLYPTGRAIEFHREFAGKYLISLPVGNFHYTLTVPI